MNLIAVEYLHLKNALKEVVLDPYPVTDLGLERLKQIKNWDIKIVDEVSPNSDYIFVGGALTKLAKYLENNTAKTIVINGGFVGANIIDKKHELMKFKNKLAVRTYNFNLDVVATQKVINSSNYQKMYLVGKNVCHSILNTTTELWKNESFLNKYNLSPQKRLHDLLMCREGLLIINNQSQDSYIEYKAVQPKTSEYIGSYTGNMVKWGSEEAKRDDAKIIAAINFKD